MALQVSCTSCQTSANVTGILQMKGNDQFLGPGTGLPNGGPEVVVDSIPSAGDDQIQQIMVGVSDQ